MPDLITGISDNNDMLRDQIIKILIHPFFIGLVVTGIVLGLLKPEINRYRVEVVERKPNVEQRFTCFSDLDHDGTSEEIIVETFPNILKLMLLTDSRLIEQYNLRSDQITGRNVYFGDYNRDGYGEIYLITTRNDSILLSIIDPLLEEDFIVKEKLVFHNDTIRYEVEWPEVTFVGLADFSCGANKSLLFSICTGFSKQPRNVYRYRIETDRLEISPLSGASINRPVLCDLDMDSLPEILYNTAAPGNYQSFIPYTDHSAWLMVLDDDMDFLFEPLEFPGYPSNLLVAPFSARDSMFMAVLHHYYGTEQIRSGFYVYDNQGRMVRSRNFDLHRWGSFFLVAAEHDHKPVISILDIDKQVLSEYDEFLNLTGKENIPSLSKSGFMLKADLDNNGSREWVFTGERHGSFVIFRDGFRLSLEVDMEEEGKPIHFCTLERAGKNFFYVQYRHTGYIAAYEKNPYFLLKYPFVLAIWLLVSLAVLLIFRLQKYRAHRQYVTQRKINELQILSLKNQIDPHFTFNILNAIGSLHIRGTDPNKAYNIFMKYSDLLRQTIKNSDKISVSLEEEIRFTENYIELEQIRSDYSFQCRVDIGDDVDLRKKIPRMLVYSFVENSIKHGIRRVKKEGRLEISISRTDHQYHISIRDNGPGLHHKTETRNGTGKGIQIIDELVALFQKLEGMRITYQLKDLSSEGHDERGTEVLISIPD